MKAKTKDISYNPFRMWGSWVGAVMGLYLCFSQILFFTEIFYRLVGCHGLKCLDWIELYIFFYCVFIILGVIIGFTAGAIVNYKYLTLKLKENKQTYNPFRMLGGIIGIITFFALSFAGSIPFLHNNTTWNIILKAPYIIPEYIINFVRCSFEELIGGAWVKCSLKNIVVVFINLVWFFLIGWLVHSLFRYINNRKRNQN